MVSGGIGLLLSTGAEVGLLPGGRIANLILVLLCLLEEVVGRVGEEGISPEEEYASLGENTYQIDGGMSIDEVRDELGVELATGEYETVAGFVLDVLGHIPTNGEQFEYSGHRIEVTSMTDMKIETIKLTKGL